MGVGVGFRGVQLVIHEPVIYDQGEMLHDNPERGLLTSLALKRRSLFRDRAFALHYFRDRVRSLWHSRRIAT